MVAIPLLTAMAPAMAQNTVYAGQSSDLSVITIPGDAYVWELYNSASGVNFATDPGNCPPGDAYFTGGFTGPLVNVMWLTPGTYFFKVTAYRGGCTMNLKVGKMIVLPALPTAVIVFPLQPICEGDPVHLTVQLTGTAPWSFTLTDGSYRENQPMGARIMLPAATARRRAGRSAGRCEKSASICTTRVTPEARTRRKPST